MGMRLDDLHLHDADLEGITVVESRLTLRSYHWHTVESNRQVFRPVICFFNGISNLRVQKPVHDSQGRPQQAELGPDDWAAHTRVFAETLKRNHNHIEGTFHESVMQPMTLDEFLTHSRNVQATAGMPMGIADVYHTNDFFQIDMHTELRLSFNFASADITLGDQQHLGPGHTVMIGETMVQTPAGGENNQ